MKIRIDIKRLLASSQNNFLLIVLVTKFCDFLKGVKLSVILSKNSLLSPKITKKNYRGCFLIKTLQF